MTVATQPLSVVELLASVPNKGQPLSERQRCHYDEMGLPHDYPYLNAKNQLKTRKKSLQSWFDPDPAKCYILCTDTEKFLKAFRLWVEYYMKPSKWNAGTYHFTDPLHKYEMVQAAMSPPKTPNQPSKTACVAPRRSTKTHTLIQQMCSMMAVTRTTPIQILISERNKARTDEEMQDLRHQFENNERIHADFGSENILFPRTRTGGRRWNNEKLQFCHNRSTIVGVSVSSAHRGRGNTFGIIDDPEDDEDSLNAAFRSKYFRWLFKAYLFMFGPGAKILWISTMIDELCCMQMAMRGLKEVQTTEDDEVQLERDARFDDWNLVNISLIREDKNGKRYSIFPDRTSVADFDAYKKTHGLAAAMCEMQGVPMAGDQFCFSRDPMRHGYIRAIGEDGDYFLDLNTGRKLPWDEFVKSLYVVGAGDFGSGMSPTCCPGAIVLIGRDAWGTVYVLDVYNRRCHPDDLIEMMFEMAPEWHTQRFAFEAVSMQTVDVHRARRRADELRAEGKEPPLIRGITNQKIDKVRLIIATLRPLINNDEIRFRQFDEQVKTIDGVHKVRSDARQRYHGQLAEQVDMYTDERALGLDDAIDALQMSIRFLGSMKGEPDQTSDDPNEEVYARWAEAGLLFDKKNIPLSCWTKEMFVDSMGDNIDVAKADEDEMDPYE